MKKFLEIIKTKAKENPKRILFPETFDERTLRAVIKILEEQTAIPILFGTKEALGPALRNLGYKDDLDKFIFIDTKDKNRLERYAEALYELRKAKGLTKDQARALLDNINYLGVMVVQMEDADGLITGANSPTSETLKPALQIIKTKEAFHKVSGFFFMILEERLLMFADCAVNIEPNSKELAEIAIDTAENAKRFGIEPRIAMLSFSTAGSAKHPNADRVREATKMVQHYRPDLICDGEMQVDAALVPEVCARKYPNAVIKGNANVLIFPNLEAANISYKLVERLAKAEALGPILQGLRKPVNDLSRGCSVEDISDLAAITCVEAQGITLQTKDIISLK